MSPRSSACLCIQPSCVPSGKDHNRYLVIKERWKNASSECSAQNTIVFPFPLLLNFSFHLNKRISFPETLHFCPFLSDSISPSSFPPGPSKRMRSIFRSLWFWDEQKSAKAKEKHVHLTLTCPHSPATTSGFAVWITSGCPIHPHSSSLNSRTNICPVFEQSLRAFFFFFFFF